MNALFLRQQVNEFVDAALTVQEQRDQLASALRLFVAQWNACGPNSDFGRHFQNVRDAAVTALTKARL